MAKILGLSFFYHDSAAALTIDGVPVALAQEERFSRKKGDASFPEKSIEFVLKEAGLLSKDLDYVVFYEKPFLKFERVIKTQFLNFPFHPFVFAASMRNLLGEKLWIREIICNKLKISPKKVLFCSHHLSHASSAFFPSPFEEAVILTVDGVGEWTTTAISVGRGNNIEMIKEIYFPHSLGLLYSTFTAFLGFEVNEGEYKVMGMAPYGYPKHVEEVKKLINLYDDGSFSLNLDYFSFHKSLDRTYSEKFLKLFGKPRNPASKFFTRETGWPSYFGEKPDKFEYEKMAMEQENYANIAASIQSVLEEALINLAKEAYRMTNLKYLCLGGGVALNSVANWKIYKSLPFEEVFIQPAAGDAGGALGAALCVEHMMLGSKRNFVMKNASFGKSYSAEEINLFLSKNNIKDIAVYYEDEDRLIEKVVEELLNGKVIGWFHGKFEWGPRALGNRSILADPRIKEMKDIVNTKIKFREPYRPFAPSVLIEHAEDWFEITEKEKEQHPFRFMLYVVPVKKEKWEKIKAVTHVDFSARPQFVYKEENPRYYKLILKFYKETGIPMILNTSFNLKGEPIVNSPEDAFSTFIRSGLDVLVLENFIIKKDSLLHEK
ncbi:MAG: carbamoyltransferase N-terminal domain-containing protein [Candidatus Hydrothermales bacterium]